MAVRLNWVARIIGANFNHNYAVVYFIAAVNTKSRAAKESDTEVFEKLSRRLK